MFGNSSKTINQNVIHYPALDRHLSFADYREHCRAMIAARREDLAAPNAQLIIDANAPFELAPLKTPPQQKLKYGALLIHGLFDCPFSLKEIGTYLQSQGVLCRALLLPGHGTIPKDLLTVSYTDWIKTVRYGTESLLEDVEKVFLIGYSTGATLSLYQALQNKNIAGLILLAPAIRIKVPMNRMVQWDFLQKWLTNYKQWITQEEEIDYTKYRSIPLGPVMQLTVLTNIIGEMKKQHALTCPVMMVLSREDETISTQSALEFFSDLSHPKNQLLLYSHFLHEYADSRIIVRPGYYPDLHIEHISHVSIPFAPDNFHYGQQGDFIYASNPHTPDTIYGAYNRLEVNIYERLYKLGISKQHRRELTYNPDFDFMMKKIGEFIVS